MNETLIAMACSLGGLGMGAATVYIWLAGRIATLKERVAHGMAQQSRQANLVPLTVQVSPYLSQATHAGILRKTASFELGYQYQLLVHGVPCFEPHVTVVEHRQESIVNEATLQRMMDRASDLAQAAVGGQAAPAGTLMSVARTVTAAAARPRKGAAT